MTSKTVTRSTLVDALSQKVGLSKNECAKFLGDFLGTITDCLAEGATIKVSNFGSFVIRHKGARIGRNPNTGEEAPISERQVIVFKPAQKFKSQVNDPDAPQRVQINLAAQELVDRHGDVALAVAKERVDYLERSGEQREIDLAMLMLSQVEGLVKRL